MALALLVLAITKRATGVARLLPGKTTPVELITTYAAALAIKGVFVAVLNAGITKREGWITWLVFPLINANFAYPSYYASCFYITFCNKIIIY